MQLSVLFINVNLMERKICSNELSQYLSMFGIYNLQ